MSSSRGDIDSSNPLKRAPPGIGGMPDELSQRKVRKTRELISGSCMGALEQGWFECARRVLGDRDWGWEIRRVFVEVR